MLRTAGITVGLLVCLEALGQAPSTGRRPPARLDVSVRGPEEAIRSLTEEDFDLRVGGRRIEEFDLDRICEAPAPGDEVPPTAPATFVFYFDQNLFSVAGRTRAFELAREMIPELVTGHSKGLVVSNGNELSTFAGQTQDVAQLTGAVDRIVGETGHWDPSSIPTHRGAPYLKSNTGSGLLQKSQQEGRSRGWEGHAWRAERSLSRLSLALGQLANVDPPKVLIFFANALGPNYSLKDPMAMGFNEWMDTHITAAIDRANAHGVRIYTFRDMRGRMITSGHLINPALPILSRGTGGESLGDPTAASLASHIRKDLACLYLLSFDTEGLEEDVPHAVEVSVNKRRVKANARSSLTVLSDLSRRTDRLLAAFGSSEAAGSPVALRGLLIPTGYHEGRYRALVQTVVDGSTTSGSVWDIGSSLISEGSVRESASGRLTVERADLPVVFESEMSFQPGEFELTLVAQETHRTIKGFNQVGARGLAGAWPRPEKGDPFVGPIAIVQTVRAVFLREGQARQRGLLAVDGDQPVSKRLPATLISLVCRGSEKGPLQVARQLVVGGGPAEFGGIELDDGDTCASIRDVIPADVMAPGSYRYEVRLLKDDRELAAGVRSFVAADPAPQDENPPAGS